MSHEINECSVTYDVSDKLFLFCFGFSVIDDYLPVYLCSSVTDNYS